VQHLKWILKLLTQRHLNNHCPNVTVTCPKCAVQMLRKNEQLHQANECPFTVVLCLLEDTETVRIIMVLFTIDTLSEGEMHL
jgi:hypothetical protein